MYKKFLYFFSIIPLPVSHFFGYLIGLVSFISKSKTSKVIKKNIEICFPDLGLIERKALELKSNTENAKALCETGNIWLNDLTSNHKMVKSITGLEFLDNEKHTVLFIPHFGCWEIIGRALIIEIGRKITFMYKKQKSEDLDSFILSKRVTDKLSMASSNNSGIKKIYKALLNNELVGILPDQVPNIGGSKVEFFGHKALTMNLLIKISKKFDANVLTVWAERLSFGRGYKIYLKPVDITSSNNEKENLLKMNQEIEKIVKTAPSQYLWSYKRFKGIVDYNSL